LACGLDAGHIDVGIRLDRRITDLTDSLDAREIDISVSDNGRITNRAGS
jgi:hypothetical protein